MLLKQACLTTAVALTAATTAPAFGQDKVTREGDTIRVQTPDRPEAYLNPWTKEAEDAYWQRATPLIASNRGKVRTDTPGEHEKWSIPQTILAYLAGTDGALEALTVGLEPRSKDHGFTDGVDYYWSFTLKGQARKYFFFKDQLPEDYTARMKSGGDKWTETDPKPTMELVLALGSENDKVREMAAATLAAMRANLTPEAAAAATNPEAKAAIEAYLASDLVKGDYGQDIDKWSAWWAFFSGRGWKVFEEVERLTNPNPHPAHGRGTGPVGATWDPKVRGMRADARNTDNLRGMREVAVYLFAEETGNEDVRLLYKQKLRRTAEGFLGIGMGEWDSPTYHSHSFAAYLNLYDFAKDEQVLGYAKAICDYLATAAAVKYFHGGWAGPNKRDYGTIAPGGAAAAFYPYFGAAPHGENDLELAFVFTSSYRPPMAAVAFAQKNFKQGVEMLNTHPAYENWLPGEGDAPRYHETTFIGDGFQLGTMIGGAGYDENGFKLLVEGNDGLPDFFVAGSFKGKIRNPATTTAGGDRIAQYRNLALVLNGRADEFYFLHPQGLEPKKDGSKLVFDVNGTKVTVTPINVKTGKTVPANNKNQAADAVTFERAGDGVAGLAIEVGGTEGTIDVDGDTVALTGSDGGSVKMAYTSSGLPPVWRNGQPHDWTRHAKALYATTTEGPRVTSPFGETWLEIEAGGHRFRGELKDDGSYVTTNE